MTQGTELRVLIIDDSAFNRRALSSFLEAIDDVSVVGKASDGDEGLKMALKERPDVITLDLEMPRMDGFTFLRILMARSPTPVIVISSHAQRENIFRALELGAFDFVAKPSHLASTSIEDIREEVVRKVLLSRVLKPGALRPMMPAVTVPPAAISPRATVDVQARPAHRIVALAASTGGPASITRILSNLPAKLDAAIVVVQHMPPRFTTSFAQRLNRVSKLQVHESTATAKLLCGNAYIAPGQGCIELFRKDGDCYIMMMEPTGRERYVPSADTMFTSAAKVAGSELLAIVLTGMGDDGARGVRDVARMGGTVVVEDEETAIIAGMPRAAKATGVALRVAQVDDIAEMITDFASPKWRK